MTTESEIKRYIKNYFHPYYDITLSPSITENSPNPILFTEPINCIIPVKFRENEPEKEDLNFTHNKSEIIDDIDTILEKYDDTDIQKEYEALCTRIIDGDTIEVQIIKKLSQEETTYDNTPIRIRLVGINTPEQGSEGFTTSTKFVEKMCKNKTIYLNIDDKTPQDKYGRTLAVVIVQNKNLNQILLKEGLAEIMFIPPSEFNPFAWDNSANVSNVNILEANLSAVLPYINNEFNNIVFTNQDNYDIIHKYEIYKGIIYLRLYPYNSNICLHILPKSYKGDSNLLIFKDELVTKNNITKSNCISKPFPPINCLDNEDNSSYEMNYNISNSTKGFSTLQINAGYKYPISTTKIFHLTGVKDETNEIIEDRCTLLDANYDVYSDPTNNITQFMFISNNITPPNRTNLNIQKFDKNKMDINHIGKNEIFHKTVKYMNDDMYIEEIDTTKNISEQRRHIEYNWGE